MSRVDPNTVAVGRVRRFCDAVVAVSPHEDGEGWRDPLGRVTELGAAVEDASEAAPDGTAGRIRRHAGTGVSRVV